MQFIDLLLVRWIFGRQIGHKNYEDFEHPTCKGKSIATSFAVSPGNHNLAAMSALMCCLPHEKKAATPMQVLRP